MDRQKFELDAVELQKYQPNRYPLLLVDYVTEVVPGEYAKGYKNLSNNEWFFPKHFEGNPNMPGCLQIEAMAQLLTIAITTVDGMEGKVVHGYKHMGTFHDEVKPGSRLDMEAKVTYFRRGLCKGKVEGYIQGRMVCELDTTLIIPEIFNKFKPETGDKS